MELMYPLCRRVKTQAEEINAQWQKTQGHVLDAVRAQ